MVNINIGQPIKMWLTLWPNLIPYSQLLNGIVAVLLLTSTPLVLPTKICSILAGYDMIF